MKLLKIASVKIPKSGNRSFYKVLTAIDRLKFLQLATLTIDWKTKIRAIDLAYSCARVCLRIANPNDAGSNVMFNSFPEDP